MGSREGAQRTVRDCPLATLPLLLGEGILRPPPPTPPLHPSLGTAATPIQQSGGVCQATLRLFEAEHHRLSEGYLSATVDALDFLHLSFLWGSTLGTAGGGQNGYLLCGENLDSALVQYGFFWDLKSSFNIFPS